ncbi:phosphoribosylamine--glycine ligase [Anabaena sp. FACHB-1237]|uniref:phosphoribosylamine--glycine ligase n=1 Tax=Anabaena sp. FACHB-1237 TaxID=2692769 RepID=UPI0016819DD9|nr:phosphoribosylamine--glycine ligase [Anabaena sp. FACHB-1237]MBD2137176.1 phosphoribosylamine--glycine ligase [Anabaena sp. FACHB-1237]
MKVLVIGNGGREHALAWKLLQSDKIKQVVCIPGNGGTATMKNCQNIPLALNDFAGISKFAIENAISLVVVGPEVPLAEGITDYLKSSGLRVFGPNKAGARIEASKAWAKELMVKAGVPTAKAAVFTEVTPAKEYVKSQGVPIVIKADGLAAGKGVTVAETLTQAENAIDAIFDGQFGSAGSSVVIEECLLGEEVSVLAITDGISIRPLLPAQDHKRIGEGDTGENTGGMGAYTPAPIATPELMERVQIEVLEKTITALQDQGIDYQGILYAGLMITPDGDFRVLEFNCRFGDPETQVILPMLETPLEDLMFACIEKRLGDMPPIVWKQGFSATVVAAAGGYPGNYEKNDLITGLADAEGTGARVFHAGTRLNEQDHVVTNGGRVLNITGTGRDFSQAIAQAYSGIAQIKFNGMYYRRDIGHRLKKQ